MGRLTLPVDTADQVVCPAGQTYGHSSPWVYHDPSRQTVEQNWISNYPINVSQWPYRDCFDPLWFDRVGKKLSVKACIRTCISIAVCYCVCTVLECGYKKMDFNFCAYMVGFLCKSSHILHEIQMKVLNSFLNILIILLQLL